MGFLAPRTAQIKHRSFSWGNTPLSGPYTLAPNVTTATVITPNGNPPVEGDLFSHRYRHHTRIAVVGSRLWVMFSSSGTNEDAGGQMTLACSSTDGVTWSAPSIVVPPQSTFSGTGATAPGASERVSWPREFQTYNGNLYAIAAIQSADSVTGLALVAAQCKTDGTLGPLFRVSDAAYTALSGVATIPYDATLGPALFPHAILYGVWGGTSTGPTATAQWIGWAVQNALSYTEPATVDRGDGVVLQLWRAGNQNTTWLFERISRDNGQTWGPLTITDMPNAPSAATVLRLADGRTAMAGNAQDYSFYSRDPLYLALFDANGVNRSMYAVRQGVLSAPVYPGTNKAGACAYPGIAEWNGGLWISYSIHKEDIAVTKVPLAGL